MGSGIRSFRLTKWPNYIEVREVALIEEAGEAIHPGRGSLVGRPHSSSAMASVCVSVSDFDSSFCLLERSRRLRISLTSMCLHPVI